MKELMQKALSAFASRKSTTAQSHVRADIRKTQGDHQSESWEMTPEDALRVGTVARYK
jgi:hypothetical protein